MMFFVKKRGYITLENSDEEAKGASRHVTVEVGSVSVLSIIGLFLLTFISTWVLIVQTALHWNVASVTSVAPGASSVCVSPPIRREWRTLSSAAKQDYISAVQCLTTKPSRLREEGSLYEDFPWLHQEIAQEAHKGAPFFPWHRYFVQVYEDALKNDCGYKGVMPYWDWSADAHDFAKAPVWDAHSGFGGNGVGDLTVGEGLCVKDGPFADLKPSYYGDKYEPHCLSRGFSTGAELEKLCDLIKPEVIEDIMQEDDFTTFAERLEYNAHHFAQRSIKGEFSAYTGPYDPVFFLHHVNLDRLWWQWQQQDPINRGLAYSGRAPEGASIQTVKLTNELNAGELKRSVSVIDTMSTQNDIFCYQY